MEADGGTGRITRTLTPTARRILFQRNLEEQIDTDLPLIARIDTAHLLMLMRRKIIDRQIGVRLLRAVNRLVDQQFDPLKSGISIRGAYLLYESYLIETEGEAVGGVLQTGRSRNDLNATLLRLRLREPYRLLMRSALRLQALMLRRAEMYAGTVMPAYTHGQAAEPITYGHYLAGVAAAIQRDIDGLLEAAREIDTSPLGACAGAGSSLPIDPAMTADLLGFARTSPNSIDAVASRDMVLRLLAGMAVCGVTLSRIATDLLQWLTEEFRFLTLPDEMVGSSSAMPQKRNPFLLEHVQGRTASALGAFTAALAASRNVSFSNSISVGTESVRPVWGAFQDLENAANLLRLVIGYARPCPERMLYRTNTSFINATAFAVQLVLERGIDFRSAHHAVGRAVTEAVGRGMSSLEELGAANAQSLDPSSESMNFEDMDPVSCVRRAQYGGGPAPECINAHLKTLRACWSERRRRIQGQTGYWAAACNKLEASVSSVCGR